MTDDVLRILQERKAYHEDQVRRFQTAIDALSGGKSINASGPSVHRYSWSVAIDEAFEDQGEMTLDQIREKLNQAGLPSFDRSSSGSIFAALSRKVKQGRLLKTDSGSYRKAQ